MCAYVWYIINDKADRPQSMLGQAVGQHEQQDCNEDNNIISSGGSYRSWSSHVLSEQSSHTKI